MARLLFNKWYGGISNDPNIGQVGSVYNAECVQIRENSKKVTLTKNNPIFNTLTSNLDNPVIGYLTESSSNFLRLHLNGHITDLINNNIDNGDIIINLGGRNYNIGSITLSTGKKGFILSNNKFYYWNYMSNNTDLGIINGGNIVSNPNFNSNSNWSISGTGTGWTLGGGQAIHSSGNIDKLSQTLSVTNGVTYRVVVNGNVSVGSAEIRMGGSFLGTLSNSNNIGIFLRTTSSNSEDVEIVPTGPAFEGTITSVKVELYTIKSSSYTFNEFSPFYVDGDIIYVGNGNKITEIDGSGGTFALSDTLTIDREYTIKGISQIGDQYYVYATNGSNTKQYLWDGVTETAERVITWRDKALLNVANFGNIDYLIIGGGLNGKSGLYVVNGYNLEDIFKNNYNQNIAKERFYFYSNYVNAIETIGDNIIIPGIGNVYSYGRFTRGLPTALVKDYLFNYDFFTGNQVDNGYVTSMDYSERTGLGLKYSYVGRDALGNKRVMESLIQFNVSGGFDLFPGWIELNPQFGNTYSDFKDLIKFTIGYKLKGNGSIGLYYKKEGYANLIVSNPFSESVPIVGDTYLGGGYTFKITGVTQKGGNNLRILHCTYTGSGNKDEEIRLTKDIGGGDTFIYAKRIKWDWRFITQTQDINKTRLSGPFTTRDNEVMFALHILSYSNESPELYDFNLYFNQTTND